MHREYLKPHNLYARVNGETVEFPEFSVLRDSVRTVTTDWADPPMACVCRITVSTTDGKGHTVTAQARVIVFPFALVGGSAIAALGFLLFLRRLRHRSQQKLADAYERGRDAAGATP